MSAPVPTPMAVLATTALVAAAILLVFTPDPPPLPRRRKDVERLLSKYVPWLVPAGLVAVVHVLELQLDPRVSARLGYDLGPALAALEAPLRGFVAEVAPASLLWLASAWYVLVHPAVVLAAVLLFTLTDEERAARAALVAFPLAYGLSVPFWLFAPASTPQLAAGEAAALFDRFPDYAAFWWNLTTPDNTLPSFHVALAALVWNASRYSRNRRFRRFAGLHAIGFTAAALLTGMHWATGVAVALVVAGLAALYTRRIVDVERIALQRVKPAPEAAQRIRENADALVQRVGDLCRAGTFGATPMLVGSVAKDTYLREKADYDVFVLFPPEVPREAMEEAGLEIGRAALDQPVEKYAEHPYVHGLWRGAEADVVPAFRIEDPSERMTAVDRTPFHTRYVLKRMTREQRDETRILKAFLTGIGAYGAEARVRGFSGYLSEILVLKHGSFRGVVRAGARFKPGTYLAAEVVEGNPRFPEPLVFLDPVDPRRNAASAVSEDTLALFAEACRAYLGRPGLTFFFPRPPIPLAPERLRLDLKRRKGEILLVSMARPDALEDHLHDQLRKTARATQDLLERHDFEVRRVTTELAETEARLLVEVARLKLSEGAVHAGPPVDVEEHAERFRKAWSSNPEALSEVFVEGGRLKVKRRRRWRRADDLLREELSELDLGKHLGAAAKERLAVESGPAAVREDTALLVTRHLDRRRPWER